MRFIIYNPATHLFDFFIEAITFELKKKGIDFIIYDEITTLDSSSHASSRTSSNASSPNSSTYNIPSITTSPYNFNPKDDILLIIVNPHFIFDYKDIYDQIVFFSKKYTYKIFYITEPMNYIIEQRVYQDLIKIIKPYSIWTYTYNNFNKLKFPLVPLSIQNNIFKVFPINMSYNFIQNIDIYNLTSRNRRDIVFFGNINETRKQICDSLSQNLINITDKWLKEEWTTILNNHLFYLNVHRRKNCESFESFRIVPILANGGVIFSERTNPQEEEEYKDYNIIFTEKDSLKETFYKYIESPIDYEDILNKTILFRNRKMNTLADDWEKYLSFHNNL